MSHTCHANGCSDTGHPEVPFCKRHFQLLPEAHRKRLWAEREPGVCGACVPDNASKIPRERRGPEWGQLLNLGIAIIALVEAPEYDPREEWMDEHGFCWMAGIHDATKTTKTARAVIKKFGLAADVPAY